jgi:hypothetical protein
MNFWHMQLYEDESKRAREKVNCPDYIRGNFL